MCSNYVPNQNIIIFWNQFSFAGCLSYIPLLKQWQMIVWKNLCQQKGNL